MFVDFLKKIAIFECVFLILSTCIYLGFEKGYASALVIPGALLVIVFTRDEIYKQ